MIAAIGLLGRGEAGELAHGPELAAVHVAMNAARVGELAGWRDFSGRERFVKRLDFDAADRGESALGDPKVAHLLTFSLVYSVAVFPPINYECTKKCKEGQRRTPSRGVLFLG